MPSLNKAFKAIKCYQPASQPAIHPSIYQLAKQKKKQHFSKKYWKTEKQNKTNGLPKPTKTRGKNIKFFEKLIKKNNNKRELAGLFSIEEEQQQHLCSPFVAIQSVMSLRYYLFIVIIIVVVVVIVIVVIIICYWVS